MYEPIRTKSVHSTMAGTPSDFPHRSREEELDIQLAGHLAALLAVTDELRTLAPAEDLDIAAERLAAQVARLRGGLTPPACPRQRPTATPWCCTSGRTPSPGAPWSWRPPAPTRRPRSSPPSRWTCTRRLWSRANSRPTEP